jgi:hypothetical protein
MIDLFLQTLWKTRVCDQTEASGKASRWGEIQVSAQS